MWGISGILFVGMPSRLWLAGYFRHFICCLALSVAACGVFQAFFLSSCPPNRNLRGIFGILSVVLPSRLQLVGYFRHFVCRNALPIVACGAFSAFYLLSCPLGCSLRGISGIFSVVIPSLFEIPNYKVMNMPLLNVFCLQHLMSRSFEQAVHDCITDARGGKAL